MTEPTEPVNNAAKVRDLKNRGLSAVEIAKQLNLSRATVYRLLGETSLKNSEAVSETSENQHENSHETEKSARIEEDSRLGETSENSQESHETDETSQEIKTQPILPSGGVILQQQDLNAIRGMLRPPQAAVFDTAVDVAARRQNEQRRPFSGNVSYVRELVDAIKEIQAQRDASEIVKSVFGSGKTNDDDQADRELTRLIKLEQLKALRSESGGQNKQLIDQMMSFMLRQMFDSLGSAKQRPSLAAEIKESLETIRTLKELGASVEGEKNTISQLLSLANSQGFKDVASGLRNLLSNIGRPVEPVAPPPETFSPPSLDEAPQQMEQQMIAEHVDDPSKIIAHPKIENSNGGNHGEGNSKPRPRMETFGGEVSEDQWLDRTSPTFATDAQLNDVSTDKKKSMSTFSGGDEKIE